MSQNRLGKILIADNDEDVLVTLERTLEDEGYETAVTVSGDGAFRSLCSDAFDLLVLDDYLSDKNCIQVLNRCQRAGMRPPAVVTYHQFPSRTEQEQLRSLGVNTLVHKYAHAELIWTVHYLLQPLRGYSDECGRLT